MKLHELKIEAKYAKPKLNGKKFFEIRKDRDFEVNDIVQYTVIDDENLNQIIKNKLYRIIYITNYEQKDEYIVFGEEEL